MSNLKITLVGGGSFNWTPRVVCNLLGNPFLNGAHIVLYDLNPDALTLTHTLALKYKTLSGAATTFERTTDRSVALDGANAVVVTITTGGLKAMKHDLEIPEKYGIFQTVGDTVGPGGLSRSLRNVPVFLNLAKAMETYCPTAWMLNCSNPLSALTRVVVRETAIRALGVCHGVPNVAAHYARFFNAKPGDFAYVNTGIDHCAWFTHFSFNGHSALGHLIEQGLDDWLSLPPEQAQADPTFGDLYTYRCGLQLGRRFNALPAIGDRHMVEFLPGFLTSPETVEQHGLVRTSIADREKSAASGHLRIQRLLEGKDELKLTGTSDDIAGWIAALHGGPVKEDNLNAPNLGQVPQLPEGAIVETRGLLDTAGFHPLVSPMPPSLEAIVRPHALREELTVDAALEGSFEKALAALTTDPLVGTGEIARPLLEELIAATKNWLPQF